MAIIPESQYPGKITPASAEYPYGEARNITLPGDGTGTPWEAALVNDLFGMQQALLDRSEVVPSGVPDEVGASQYLEAMTESFGSSHSYVAKMIADDTLKSGQVVRTIGYYDGWAATAVPRGGARYGVATLTEIRDARGEPGWVPDEQGAAFTLNNGLVAYLLGAGSVDVYQFGARGDLSTDDTTAVQAAFDSGAGEVVFPYTALGYLCDLLAPPSSLRVIRGVGYPVIQATAIDTRILVSTGGEDLTITGMQFKGVAGSSELSPAQLINLTAFDKVKITDNQFTNGFHRCVYLTGCNDFELTSNRFIACSNGPYFTGCKGGLIAFNKILGTQQPLGTFKAGIFLQTWDATYGLNERITVAANHVRDLGDGQAIVGHGAIDVSVFGNQTSGTAQGINFNPVGDANNSLINVSVFGNTLRGVGAAPGYAITSDVGLVLSSTGATSRDITVSGNTIVDFNLDQLSINLGGVSCISIDDAVIYGNTLHNCGINGVVFSGADSSNIDVHDNTITDITGTVADGNGVKVDSPTVVSGEFRNNRIQRCDKAYRLETASLPDLTVVSTTEADNDNPSNGVAAAVFNGVLVPVDGDTAPTVREGVREIVFSNAAPTLVTDFPGTPSGVLFVRDTNGNTTLSENSDGGGNFRLSLNTNFAFGANDTIALMKAANWLEVSRSLN